LAAGLDAAEALADQVQRRGGTPVIVVLTDGRSNVGRDGIGGRAKAEQEALESAAVIRGSKRIALLVDTSLRPAPLARALASAMSAQYLPLPYVDSAKLTQAVQAVTPKTR
jgi:magnesium chelatase subunit D